MPLSVWVKQLGLLIGCALLLALALALISPQRFILLNDGNASPGQAMGGAAHATGMPEFEIFSPQEALRLFEQDRALFVDARASEEFARGHIPGAVSLPIGDFEALIEDFSRTHALSQPLVTYCSGRMCRDSHDLAQRLMDRGYTDVVVFIDGFPGWESEGYPVETR